jgi:hypothetical protein
MATGEWYDGKCWVAQHRRGDVSAVHPSDAVMQSVGVLACSCFFSNPWWLYFYFYFFRMNSVLHFQLHFICMLVRFHIFTIPSSSMRSSASGALELVS